MENERRKMIAYIVACINEFARVSGLTAQESYKYLEAYGGVDFLIDCYDSEHLLSFPDVVDDLKLITQKSGGMIA